MKTTWQTTDFDFKLPPEQIARYPLPQRTDSRLLCLNKTTGNITHYPFKALPQLLNPNDLLVYNNTRVIPARLYAQKPAGGKVEILIERLIDQHTALAHTKSNRPLKPGTKLHINNKLQATVQGKQDALTLLQFDSTTPLIELLTQHGHMPIPPYFNRPAEAIDNTRYQTIYAKHQGAVAAPTAGLHFDEDIFKELENRGINKAYLTLHVGAGTFQPVRTNNLSTHTMHSEYFDLPQETCNQIRQTKKQNARTIAVGTTVVRSLESASQDHELQPYQGETDIFIYPGYEFKTVDAIITNFHLPKSTLLMLICAFGGYEAVMNAYQEAVKANYRFFSYGDAMLILD